MKTKLILFLFCLASLNVMGQGTIQRNKKQTAQNVTSKPATKTKPASKPTSESAPKKNTNQQQPARSSSSSNTPSKQKQSSHATTHITVATGYDVEFSCNVPEATLLIDGRNYGHPSGSVYLKSGTHAVSLQADEYEEYNDSICVDSDHRSFAFAMKKSVKNEVVEEVHLTSQPGNIYNAINEVTLDEVNTAHEKSTIQSTTLNGKTFFYATIPNRPNLAVIVAKKGAYNKMTEVILPESFLSRDGQTMYIVGIGLGAFQKCKKIRKVILPNTMRYIGTTAFAMCDVNEISLNEGLLGIDSGAFGKNDIIDIILPESIVEVGELAFFAFKNTIFDNRGSQGKLYVPKTISKIGKHAFSITRNGYGAWFHSKRKILCLPDFIDLDNCKDYGINKDVMEEYLSK